MYILGNYVTKLQKRKFGRLLSYFLNMLGNKKEILYPESDIITLHVMICYSYDYVTCFHHEKDVKLCSGRYTTSTTRQI